MTVTVPTLSTSGWERGIKEKADRSMSYFIVSRYSQSQLYYGTIASLPYLIKRYADDSIELSNQIRESLLTMFQGYFDTVSVEVGVVDEFEGSARQRIEIDIIVTVDSMRYSVGRLLDVSQSLITKVTEKE